MLQISEQIEDTGVLRIKACGEIDSTSAPELEKYIFDRIDKLNTLILDMQEIPYISSAGIRVILRTDLEMKNRGEFILDNVNDIVYETIKLVNFQSFLNIKQQGQDEEVIEEIDDVEYHVKSYELSNDELEAIPELVSAYYSVDSNECLGIYNSDEDCIAYAYTKLRDESLSTFILIQADGMVRFEYVLSALEEYYSENDIKEISASFFSDDIEGKDMCLKQNQYEKHKKTYRVIYKMKNLLESKLFEKMNDSAEETTNIKTYNDLTNSQRMMLMFNYGINTSNDIDVVFSNFYISDDEVKGTLLAKEIKDNYLVVYSINAMAEESTKLAIPHMISSFLNVCRTFLGDDAKICFVFESEKQCMGIAKVLGKQDSYNIVTEYKKYL